MDGGIVTLPTIGVGVFRFSSRGMLGAETMLKLFLHVIHNKRCTVRARIKAEAGGPSHIDIVFLWWWIDAQLSGRQKISRNEDQRNSTRWVLCSR